ncbi:DUF6603 domain-containing protein [Microbacterium sp. LWS13-1.2]|uniref:DUF6603 domain-containing protein n=1 Tax=Microbacterium sp. LWS13-1.2 TaxID=3135264 RepID=A0AAU6SBB7_9MICO
MDDTARKLLAAALRYAAGRLATLDTAQKLAELVEKPLADAVQVQGHLTTAGTQLATAVTALDAGDLANGTRHLWDALGEVDAAATILGVKLDVVAQKAIEEAPPRALLQGLGLRSPVAAMKADDNGSPLLEVTWKGTSASAPPFQVDAVELTVRFGAPGLSMTVAGSGASIDLGRGTDGLIRKLIGAAGSASTDLAFTVDARGVTTRGAVGPIALPARLDAQVVELQGLDLALNAEGGDLRIDLRSRLLTELLGVLKARVDGAGLRLPIDPARILAGQQPFGDPSFLVPEAIGISLDAGPVSGGGYLRVVQGGFGGALALTIGPVKVDAFGLFREVDGAMSFVVVMSMRFPVPIELGLLFTLNAVGGIVGLGVDVMPDAIAAGIKDGVLEQLMFPPDVVAAAPTILQTLGRVFPAKAGSFVVGPMVQLAWGRPISLFTLDVGVVLAAPDPVIVIVGLARAALPTEEAPIIDLRAGVMAQFGRGKVLLRAELYNSRIALFSVYGSLGLLIRFDDPGVYLSAGGFHPKFTAIPGELTGMRRIGAEMSPPVGLQLRLEGYVAVTPNTVQFGGSIEIGYSVAVAAVRGSLTLDALIQLDPFGFEVAISAGVHVEAFGIALLGVQLSGRLTGPSPWTIEGRGRFSLPWPLPDPSIDVGPITFGPSRPASPALEAVAPLAKVAEALNLPEAWQRAERAGQYVPVRMTPVPGVPAGGGDSPTVIAPWELVRCSQRRFPWQMTIERVGAAPVAPAKCRLAVPGGVRVGAVGGAPGAAVDSSSVTESFAIGQLLQLSADAQLGAPDFEDRQGGLTIDLSTAETDAAALLPFVHSVELEYEDSWPGRPEEPIEPMRLLISDAMLRLLLDAGPAGSSALRSAEDWRPQLAERRIEVRPVSEVRVTDVASGALRADFAPWSDALFSARGVQGGLAAMTRVGA